MSSIEGAFGIIGCGGTQGAGFDFGSGFKASLCGAALGFRFFFLVFLGGLCQNGFRSTPLSAFVGQTNPRDSLIQISGYPDLNAGSEFSIDAADSARPSCNPKII